MLLKCSQELRARKGMQRTAMVLLIPALLAFSGCGREKSLVLSGTVESTQMDVNSEVAGKILKLEKEEGALVKRGDVMAVIDTSTQELAVKQQEAVVKLKKAKLDELKEGSREEQIKQAEASARAAKAKLDELKAGTRPEQIRQAEATVNTAKAAVDNAEISYNYLQDKYDKVKVLYQSNGASENDLQDAKYKLDTANQQLVSAREQLRTAQSQLELLQNGATSQSIQAAQASYEQAAAQLELLKNGSANQTIKAAEADLEQSQASLDQAKLVLGKYQIKAPADGTYLFKNANIGDIVNAGTSVATLSDLTDLWVKVYIPQRSINAVSLGQEIRLKSISAPEQTIKGEITFISSEGEFTPKNTETTEAKENIVFKLKIKITDKGGVNLKPGMNVEAYIPTNQQAAG